MAAGTLNGQPYRSRPYEMNSYCMNTCIILSRHAKVTLCAALCQQSYAKTARQPPSRPFFPSPFSGLFDKAPRISLLTQRSKRAQVVRVPRATHCMLVPRLLPLSIFTRGLLSSRAHMSSTADCAAFSQVRELLPGLVFKYIDETNSTQDVAKQSVPLPSGVNMLAISAGSQTKGRGTHGRQVPPLCSSHPYLIELAYSPT